jgi:phage terminase large subunit
LEGGTRSGKTYSVLAWMIKFCLDPDHEGVEIAIVRKTLASIKPTVLKDFIAMLQGWGLYNIDDHNKTENIYVLGGNTISFFGADNDKKLHGFSCDILYPNEALELDYDEWLQLKMRTRWKIVIDYNPSSNDHYLYDELDGDENSVLLTTTYLDNPHLPLAQIKEIEKLEDTDEALYKVYGEGKRGQIKGLVFSKYKIVPEMPQGLRKRGYALDFGFTNDPSVLLDIGIIGDNIFVDELIFESGLTNPDLSERFNEIGLIRNNLIIADSSEPKSIKELSNLGHYIEGVKKGVGSIEASISTVKRYTLNFTARSVNSIKEVRNYKYKTKDGKEINEPIDAFNHAMDAIRYYAIKNIGTGSGWGMS